MGKRKKSRGDDDAYEYFKVKVPKYDKEGNDVSDIEPTVGGRRRKDGTYAAVSYDFEPLNEGTDSSEVDEYSSSYFDLDDEQSEDESSTIDATFELLNIFMTFLNDNPELVAKAMYHIKRGLHKVAPGTFGKPKKSIYKRKSRTSKRHKNIETELKEYKKSLNKGKYSEDSQKGNSYKTMSETEAKLLIIKTLNSYIQLKKNMERLRNAGIVNNYNEEIEMSDVVKKLDKIMEQYPALMDLEFKSDIDNFLALNTNNNENKRIREALRI